MAGIDAALDVVRRAARDIRRIEVEAGEALYGRGDTARHRALLTEKCETLVALPDTVGPLLPGAGGDAPKLKAGLEDFARRANQALDLESIFYMAALLYPEDYADGDPNDLERFLAEFDVVAS